MVTLVFTILTFLFTFEKTHLLVPFFTSFLSTMFTLRLLTRMSPRSVVQSVRVSPSVRMMSAQSLPLPDSENTPTESKRYPDKIVQIVDYISQLTLLEVADLNELLKARLKITDAPVMMAGSFGSGGPGAGAAAPAPEEEEEAAPAVAVQVLLSFFVAVSLYLCLLNNKSALTCYKKICQITMTNIMGCLISISISWP